MALLHYAAAIVAVATLMAIWRDCYRYMEQRTASTSRLEGALTAAVAAIVPAVIAYAAFVLGARL